MSISVIIGLGNPGEEYSGTRHNLGFMVVDFFREKMGFPRWKKNSLVEISEGLVNGREIILAKPRTYMNLSGNAALSLMTRYRVSPADLLVVFDDLALPFGKLRFRPSGGAGGHKGLGSIIEKTGREDIPRLRIGISQPAEGTVCSDYVLSPLTPTEREQLPEILRRSVEGIETFLSDGIETAMNRYN